MKDISRTADAEATWPEAVFATLKEAGVLQVAYVPDAGHAHLIRAAIADPQIDDILLRPRKKALRSPAARGWAASGPCS